MRLSVTPNLQINAFNGATITEKDAGIKNGIVESRNGINYLTQRPAIDVFDDASDTVGDARGRGIHYWSDAADLYFINDGTLYKNSYATTVSTSPTAGTKKCFFREIGSLLVLLDPENSQAFTITTGDVVTEITDTNFPPKQTPAVSLAYGGAVLDKYLFVLGTDGIIYNSNVSTPGTWTALDYIEAERESDGGVYLGKHHDNLAVYGVRTLEFLYDAANNTGSPLNRRSDIAHQVGCYSGESVWEEGDRSFFIGNDFSGALKVFSLENFGIKKVSTSGIDSLLTQALTKEGYYANGCGISGNGHIYYIINLYTTPSDSSVTTTLVYDDTTGLWGEWETTVNGLSKFPLMDWSIKSESSRYGEGILFNGDMITMNDSLIPQDTLLAYAYMTTGYVTTGYVITSGESGTNISLNVRTGQNDFGNDVTKSMPYIRHVGDKTTASQNLTIKWAKENNASFSSGVTIDMNKYQKVSRIGRFRRINFDLTYAGSEAIRLEGLEGDPRIGVN